MSDGSSDDDDEEEDAGIKIYCLFRGSDLDRDQSKKSKYKYFFHSR